MDPSFSQIIPYDLESAYNGRCYLSSYTRPASARSSIGCSVIRSQIHVVRLELRRKVTCCISSHSGIDSQRISSQTKTIPQKCGSVPVRSLMGLLTHGVFARVLCKLDPLNFVVWDFLSLTSESKFPSLFGRGQQIGVPRLPFAERIAADKVSLFPRHLADPVQWTNEKQK